MNQSQHRVQGFIRGGSLLSIIRISLLLILLCGVVYPLVSTAVAQLLMPSQANGSLIRDKSGTVIGSELIGQYFTDPRFFQGRVSSIAYKAEASGSNNYGPSNPDLLKRMEESVKAWKESNPDIPASRLPIALITNSASGLDPHITPESANVQIPRISNLTGMSESELEKLIREHTEDRDLQIFGEPRVNVLKLNIKLNERIQ